MRRTISVLAAVAGLSLFAGCTNAPERVGGAAQPVGGVTPAPSVTASAASPPAPATSAAPSVAPSAVPTTRATTPKASATAEETEAPTQLTLGPSGLGPLKLGMTGAQALRTGVVDVVELPEDLTGCNTDLKVKAADDADEATVFLSDLGVVSITAYPGVATPEGIKLGSKMSAVKKAYPDWESVTDPGVEGRGYAKVRGNSKAVYNITIRDGKLVHMNLQLRTQNCYE